MKANELMLGDWVYGLYPDGSRYKPPFRISAVDIYPSNKSPRIVTGGGYGFQEEHLAPIPITGEILEKNGFEKCNEDPDGAIQYEFGDEILGVDVWVNTKPCLFGAWRTWAGETTSYTMVEELPINYVHELQHALRLCGIEKEIEL